MTLHARGCLNALLGAALATPALIAAGTAWAIGVDLLPLFLSGGTGMLLLGWIALTPRRITIDAAELRVVQVLGRRTISAAAVTAVTLHWYGLQISSNGRTLRIPSLDAAYNAQVVSAAQRLLPHLRAAQARWVRAGLPLTIIERRATLVLGGAGVAGLLGLSAAVSSHDHTLALLCAGGALIGAAALLWQYPLAVHFEHSGMTEIFALRRRHHAFPAVQDIALSCESRSIRRIQRSIAVITFRFNDGRQQRWVPFETAFPHDYVDEELLPYVALIAARLRIGFALIGQDH